MSRKETSSKAPGSGGTPRVSVLIPAYNHETFIGDTLRSIAAERYSSLEVIVVDDGSADATLMVATKVCADLHLTAKVLTQQNAGTHAALARALSEATGEYVILFASDDMFYPGRLEAQVATLEANASIDAVCGYAVKLFPDGRKKHQRLPHALRAQRRGTLPHLMYTRDDRGPLLQSALFRRSVFDRVQSYERAYPPEDWWFVMSALQKGVHFVINDQPTVIYRIHGGNTHAQPGRLLEGRLRLITEKCPPRLQRQAKANVYASVARASIFEPGVAIRFLAKSVKTRPSLRNLWEFALAIGAETRHRIRQGAT